MTSAAPTSPTFEQFFGLHRPFVGRSLRHLGIEAEDVDDLTQDVFLVVDRRVRTDAIALADVGRAWLFAIARRVASNHRRGVQRRAAGLATMPKPDGPPSFDHDAALILESFLRTLDDDHQLVFVLMEVEGMTGAETSAALDVNVNTVHARLRSCRKRLERFLHHAEQRAAGATVPVRMEAR